MRILFTFMGLGQSGASKMMAWVANQMSAKGHDVHLLTFFTGQQAQIVNEAVQLHSLQIARSKNRIIRNTTGMYKTIRHLHKAVKQLKPDMVVSFLDSVSYVYLPIGRFFTKSKYVVSERVDPYSYHGNNAKIRFFLMQYADGFVFQTEGAQRYFEEYPSIYANSVVIPNPVVMNENVRNIQSRIPKFEDRDKRIVTVGRLSLKQKRQDILLEAFRIFHEQYSDYKLEIYGDGQDKDKIQEIINSMGLSDSVLLAGSTNDVEKTIFNARAFVLSSDYEGIPNALIEAMSIGVPSVSTNCSPGGAAILIKDGENGFIVPCGRADLLAEKLSVVVSDEDISTRFSGNGPSITQDFSEDIIADKWETYMEKILGKEEL